MKRSTGCGAADHILRAPGLAVVIDGRAVAHAVHVAHEGGEPGAMGPLYARGVGMLVNTATGGARRNCAFQWTRGGDCWLCTTDAVEADCQLLADYNIA